MRLTAYGNQLKLTRLVCFVLAPLSLCQVRQQQPEFEAATVKAIEQVGLRRPAYIQEGRGFQGGPGSPSPNRINYSGVTLRMLVRRAYALRLDEIAGPSWIDEQPYQVIANVPPGTDDAQLRVMLRSLLIERFQLRTHREKRAMSIYALVVARGGPPWPLGSRTPEEGRLKTACRRPRPRDKAYSAKPPPSPPATRLGI